MQSIYSSGSDSDSDDDFDDDESSLMETQRNKHDSNVNRSVPLHDTVKAVNHSGIFEEKGRETIQTIESDRDSIVALDKSEVFINRYGGHESANFGIEENVDQHLSETIERVVNNNISLD